MAAAGKKLNVNTSKTKQEALAMQSASPNTLCFPTDSNTVIFNGKEYGGMTASDRQDMRNSLDQKVDYVMIGYGLVDLDMAFGSGSTPTSDEIYNLLGRDIEDRLMKINWGSYGLLEDYDGVNHKLTVHFVDDPNAANVDLYIDDNYLTPFYFTFDHNDGTVSVIHEEKPIPVNNANYIETTGLISRILGLSGAVAVDTTSAWGHSFTEIEDMIMNQKCVTVFDADTRDRIFTSGTLQYSYGDSAIIVYFDELFREGQPVRKGLVFTKGDGNKVICSQIFNLLYQIS